MLILPYQKFIPFSHALIIQTTLVIIVFYDVGYYNIDFIIVQGGQKKSLWCDLEEKCLGNSKKTINVVFLSVYLHLLEKLDLYELWKKTLWGSKNPENGLFIAS